MSAGLNNWFCCTYWTKKIAFTHVLRRCASSRTGPCCSKDGSDPFPRQISIQWIAQLIPNTYLLNSDLSLGWRYPAFVQPAPVLHFYLLLTLSVSLTSVVCSLTPSGHFYSNFFPSNQKLYWKGKKSTNKEFCIAVVSGSLKKKKKQTFYIRLKRLTSAGVSIACESCFTCACVRSRIIATHRINVTAVRVGRALVDI